MVVRVVAYAILGAILAVVVLGGFNLFIFRAAGVDLSGMGLEALLRELLTGLPRYALLGAAVGALLAPFPARGFHPLVRLLGWTTFGVLAGLAAPVLELVVGLGRIPTASDLAAGFTVDPKAVIVGTAVGLVLSWVEAAAEAWRRAQRRRGGRSADAGEVSDVDATLKAFWRDRAESYLANRDRH